MGSQRPLCRSKPKIGRFQIDHTMESQQRKRAIQQTTSPASATRRPTATFSMEQEARTFRVQHNPHTHSAAISIKSFNNSHSKQRSVDQER